MATVYLPVEPIEGMDSAERAEALDAETLAPPSPALPPVTAGT